MSERIHSWREPLIGWKANLGRSRVPLVRRGFGLCADRQSRLTLIHRDPGKVFVLTLPLEQAAEGYKAMNERGATKVLLTL